jgi:ATP-dependent RNA helicase SUPV3L1/SUV3
MQRLSISVYARCRTSIFRSSNPDQWLNSIGLVSIFRRHRTSHSKKRKPPKWDTGLRKFPNQNEDQVSKPYTDPDNIPAWFEGNVERWAKNRDLIARLQSFGIPAQNVKPLLNKFVQEVRAGRLSSPKMVHKYGLVRFAQNITLSRWGSDMDMIYSTIFFSWASDPLHQSTLETIIPLSIVTKIQRLAKVADRYYPEEEYPLARKLNRKIIMHVGPTNSGKTHHALRALAAAPQGIYAGPLRLLAHEIWERLNLGQIVPLGMEDEGEMVAMAHPATPVPDAESALDVQRDSPVVRKLGNPKYARVCNMLTGEEQRVVASNAPLMSCTVEMISTYRMVDVAVIDEIQMIADEQRGSGWTHAVLGICAKEVHLCGEDTAVPLIQALLKDTGDELIVKRYERLTPLVVEKESLNEDLSLVRKGDCIVAFRRSSIFSIKRKVEEQTGLRCAVVYGKLPPEIRSEQAALFNDPNSGYDVMIGSDAIGMGLNLYVH